MSVVHLYAGFGIENVVCGKEGGHMTNDRLKVTCAPCLKWPAGVRQCARPGCRVVKKFRSGKKYCSRRCGAIVGAMNVSVGAARTKAKKASAAAAAARRARAEEKAAGLPAPEAYRLGRKHGYNDGYQSGRYRGRLEAKRSA